MEIKIVGSEFSSTIPFGKIVNHLTQSSSSFYSPDSTTLPYNPYLKVHLTSKACFNFQDPSPDPREVPLRVRILRTTGIYLNKTTSIYLKTPTRSTLW